MVSGLAEFSTARMLTLGDDDSSQSELSSLGSMINTASAAVSPVISPLQTPIDRAMEGDLIRSMLSLNIDGIQQLQNDSFDSSPDSSFNKGASEFLRLVEEAIARAEARGGYRNFL